MGLVSFPVGVDSLTEYQLPMSDDSTMKVLKYLPTYEVACRMSLQLLTPDNG